LPSTFSQTFTVLVVPDLLLTASTSPTIATTGAVVTATTSVTNVASVRRVVTVTETVSSVSPSGGVYQIASSAVTHNMKPGQTLDHSFTFDVGAKVPRGAYTFTATASDLTGSVTSTATFTIT
jgi:hypothetical protein